jgi:uncharacterized protein YndB with AHSA1/START domain
MAAQAEIQERRVVVERLIDAPVALVYAAWTDPAQVRQWWGPRCFTTPECEMDVRVGGRLYMIMQGPQGPGYPMDGYFQEIVPNEKLVFSNRPLGPDGQPLADGVTTVTFRAVGDKTQLTMEMVARTSFLPMLEGMDQGCNEQTDKLVEYAEALARA